AESLGRLGRYHATAMNDVASRRVTRRDSPFAHLSRSPHTRAGLPGVSPRGTADPPRPSRSSVAVRIARRKAPEGPRAIRTATDDLEGRRRWIARPVPRSERGPGKPVFPPPTRPPPRRAPNPLLLAL